MFIAFEGMDGVGKTTVAKAIAKKFNYEFKESPLKELFKIDTRLYNEICNNVNQNTENMILKSWFYALGNIYTKVTSQNKNVVVDRHLVSNYYWNATNETEEMFNFLLKIIGKPDLTIVLYANNVTRVNRIKKRNKTDEDLLDPNKLKVGYDKMITYLNKNQMEHVIIDTTYLNLEEVITVVEKFIIKYFNLEI